MHLQICQYPEATDHRIVSDIYCSRGGKWHKKISVSDSRRALNSPGRFQVVLMAAQAAPESTAATEARAVMPGTEGAAADRASLADAQSDDAQVFLCGPFFEGLTHLGQILNNECLGPFCLCRPLRWHRVLALANAVYQFLRSLFDRHPEIRLSLAGLKYPSTVRPQMQAASTTACTTSSAVQRSRARDSPLMKRASHLSLVAPACCACPKLGCA